MFEPALERKPLRRLHRRRAARRMIVPHPAAEEVSVSHGPSKLSGVYIYKYIYIYENDTLISLDQQARGKIKINWTGGA